MSPAQSLSARIAEVLSRSSSEVFGVMGNGNAWFLDAVVRDTPMTYTAVRHEAAAVAAADAYHRAGGRLAVATTTYGPGFTNALTPLAEAAQARIPLVVVTGAAPTTPRPFDVDQRALTTAAGAVYLEATPADAGSVAAEAARRALGDRIPVVIGIPYDLATAVVAAVAPGAIAPARHPSPQPDAAALARAAGLLAAARRPLVLAGRGAWLADAASHASALADELGALSSTSALAMGLLAGRARADLDLGVCGGFATETAAGLVERADVVLVLGAGLNPFTTRFGAAFGPDAVVIQVDVAEQPTHPRVDVYLRGDAAEVTGGLRAALPATRAGAWDPPAPAEIASRPDGDVLGPDGRLDPRSVLRRIDALLPEDRVVVQDGGHFIGWAPAYLRIPAPDRLLMVGTAFQTIGLGLPSAVGAGRARPDSTIVLCSGDGGALMGLADLETVARTVRRGVVLLFNDAAYGAEIHQYAARGVHDAPMLIPEVDFAALAAAAEMRSAVVRTLDDLGALAAWLAEGRDGVFCCDLRVSREVVAPYMHEVVAAASR